MSILINMEMPTRCFACPMCEVENAEVNCAISHGSYIEYREVDQNVAMQDRPEWCPLVEVPPHGDLIDRDVLRASFKESIDECHKWINELNIETSMYVAARQSLGTFVECSLRTKGMPTVIPADKDGESR